MDKFRIAFISGKLGDVDGVSLETDKWIKVLTEFGHEIFTIAGYYRQPVAGVPEEQQIYLESIAFSSPKQKYYEEHLFPYIMGGTQKDVPPAYYSPTKMTEIIDDLETMGAEVGDRLYSLIQQYKIDVLIAENTNAMPMSLLASIAIHRVVNLHRVAVIFHHHDFWWERSRFSENRIENLLNKIMPPSDLGTEHVVISSYASHILKSVKRVNPHIIPNCEDFETPTITDDWNKDFRQELGFSDSDILLIQPTRIIPRKRIEDSLKLVSGFMERYDELAPRIKFIISLYQGDESDIAYVKNIENMAQSLGIPLYLISERVESRRARDKNGRKLYTTRDVLLNADMAIYLPVWEGFGNAFLEAVSCRIPIVTTTYLVYKTDIQCAGFHTIEIRDRYKDGCLVIPDSVLEEMEHILTDSTSRKSMVEHNYKTGMREFSLSTLKTSLGAVLDGYTDEIRASRRRLIKSMTAYSV